jgi:hypothetical protein
MNAAINEMMASEHWPYIWPCYVLAIAVFAGLAVRAAVKLDHWKKRARDDG